MSGYILIVDAVPTNRIVLNVKLGSAFYETAQATNASEAIVATRRAVPSAILLGETPDMDMTAALALLRASPRTAKVPVLVLLSCPDREARLAALKAGANDVVCKPIDDVVLLARLRSLQRAREAETELAVRETTHRALGLAEAPMHFARPGVVGLVRAGGAQPHPLLDTLAHKTPHAAQHYTAKDVLSGVFKGRETKVPDAFVLVLETGADAAFALQVLPELRTNPNTRHAAVVALVPDNFRRTAATLLDMGANDLVRFGDLSVPEMLWRLDRLVAGKHKADQLRNTTDVGLRAAVTDPLTGLYNRRYALPHLTRTVEKSRETGLEFAVMVADLDHFKRINDSHGHQIGDEVLKDVSRRLRDQLRAVDMVARLGGEEFLIVMPDTRRKAAITAAQRLCTHIRETPFLTPGLAQEINTTISIGIALSDRANVTGGMLAPAEKLADALVRDADRALYDAKAHGRNTVELFTCAA